MHLPLPSRGLRLISLGGDVKTVPSLGSREHLSFKLNEVPPVGEREGAMIPAAARSSSRSSDCGALNPARHGISSIFSNKFEWPVRGAPVLVVNIQSFYSNQFFLRLSIPFLLLASPCERSCLQLPSRSHFVPTQPRVAVAEGRKEQSKFRTRWISGRAAGERKKGGNFPRLSPGRRQRRPARGADIESRDSRWAIGGEFRRGALPHPAPAPR